MIKKGILVFLLLLIIAMRILNPGWLLLLGFWLVGIPYIFHLITVLSAYLKDNTISSRDIMLYISTVAILVMTLFQYDCDDMHCYYTFDKIASYFSSEVFPFTEPSEESIGLIVVPLAILVLALDIVVLITSSRTRRKLR